MSFKNTIITKDGHALMTKVQAGTKMEFTRVRTSDYQYPAGTNFENLTSLSSIKQTALVADVKPINNVTIEVSASFSNTELTSGYYVRAVGLYANDPQKGEILYSVTPAEEAPWMPPYNELVVSGIEFNLRTVTSNAANVTVNVDPAAVATVGQLNMVRSEIADVKGFVGYTDDDIVGVEIDLQNRTFKRVAGAVNRNPGEDFDSINAFGGRRRCNVTDDGVVVAYYGEPGYSETGQLTQSITIGEEGNAVTYPAGTKVQVMVEQPKFYYKRVPLKLEPIKNGKGFYLRKWIDYVSDTPKFGFKLHPKFNVNGVILDKIYLAAFEASIYDESAEAYLLADEQIADFAADKLSSIAYAQPASGRTQNLTRANSRKLANNRGEGWQQADIGTSSITQMLFAIEYAHMNSQSKIGFGVANKASGEGNESEVTGATTHLGNASGTALNVNEQEFVSYRGEENFWGNIWGWVDGLNVYKDPNTLITNAYVAVHGQFTDDINADPYKDVGFTLPDGSGYISAFGYDEEFDFLFLPTEVLGASNLPVGDYFYNYNTGWRVARLGGFWNYGSAAGAFYWRVDDSSASRYRAFGARLVYIPQE